MQRRVDDLLVERGLAASRDEAARLIMAGSVLSGTRRIEKAGDRLAPDAPLSLKRRPAYVSRGGIKLAHALDAFSIEVEGAVALDVGASTGGFTDCLLQRGARSVYAVDVGYGQLAWRLREDPRVTVLERTNARSLVPSSLAPPPDLVVVDVSFTSLATLLGGLASLAAPGWRMVALVKPQFEVAREHLSRGLVTSERRAREAVDAVAAAAADAGMALRGRTESPIRGADGNREYFLHLTAAR